MKLSNTLFLVAIIGLSSYTLKNSNQKVKEYFSIPLVQYSNTSYQLSWSSHPSENYYKQEYLAAGEKETTFTHMIMIEAVVGNITLKDAVGAKIAELEQRKKSDALVNYQVIENKATGEYMLDFIMSDAIGTANAIVEWNAYRYSNLKGNKGVQLFALSKRGYGAATTNFLKDLKTMRPKDISSFAAAKVPQVVIK